MPQSLNIQSGSSTDQGIALIDPSSSECQRLLSYKWTNDDGEIVDTHEKLIEYFKSKGEESFNEAVKLGKQALSNIKEYGHKSWYDWSCQHWGTKWNAYEIEVDEDLGTIFFQTAWSPATPVFDKIGELFPELEITIDYYEGDFAGQYTMYEDYSEDVPASSESEIQAIGENVFQMEFDDEEEEEDDETPDPEPIQKPEMGNVEQFTCPFCVEDFEIERQAIIHCPSCEIPLITV